MSISGEVDSYEDFKNDFDREVREQLPPVVMEELWKFQGWMREHTGLASGTIVDYLKDVTGKLQVVSDDRRPVVPASVERTSAVKKYEEFLQSSTSKTETSEVNE